MICVALDTETTGKGDLKAGKPPELLQVAWVQFDDETRAIHGLQSLIVSGDAFIRAGAEHVHGISEEMRLAAGVPVLLAVAGLAGALQTARRAISFNNPFDRGVLASAALSAGLKREMFARPRLQWVDLMHLSQDVVRAPGKFGDFKWPSMDEALDALGFSLDRDKHSALADSLAAMAVYLGLKDRGLIEEREG